MDTSISHFPLDKEKIIKLLAAHSIQPTQQRVLIAETLFEKPQHLSADQIKTQINTIEPQVSKATVYNTLGLFARKGLINEVIVDPNCVFYDSNTKPHHHIYNVDTGVLEDLNESEIEISRLPAMDNNLEIAGVDVIVRVKKTGTDEA